MTGGGRSTGEEVAVEPSSRGTARVEGVHPRLVNKIQLNNENMIPDMVAPQLGWMEDKGGSYWRAGDNHGNVLARQGDGQSSSLWMDAERMLWAMIALRYQV